MSFAESNLVMQAAAKHRLDCSQLRAESQILTADDKVDPAKGLERLGDGSTDLVLVTDVGSGGNTLLAVTSLALEVGGRLGESLSAGGR